MMPKPKPLAGKKLAAKIRTAINLIESSWRNELRSAGKYTTAADRQRERSARQETTGRAMLAEALAELEPCLVYDELAALAEEDAIIKRACDAVAGILEGERFLTNYGGRISPEQIADWHERQPL